MSVDFYFIRHGQTDLNAKNDLHCTDDIGLNATGRQQAERARAIIETLPIASICVSPLKRTLETANIVAGNLNRPKIIIEDLRECNGMQWQNMQEWQEKSFTGFNEQTKQFMDRAFGGIYQSLKQEGPVLIVAHGGIHWVMCHYFNIQNHDRVIDNCIPVHVQRVGNELIARVI